MREIRLPEHLELGEAYGRVDWSVRAIWETYAGWFHQHSTLDLYGARARARRARDRRARGRHRRGRARAPPTLVADRSARGGPAVRARARGRRRAPRRARRVPARARAAARRARPRELLAHALARRRGAQRDEPARAARRAVTDTIRIDDLREPRLDAAQRAALDYVATLDIRLRRRRDARRRRATAPGATTSAIPASAPRLDAMIAAVEADTGLGPLGRLAIHQRTIRLLTAPAARRGPRAPAPRDPRHRAARADHRDRPAPLGHHAPREPHRGRHPAALAPLLGEPRTVPAPGRRARSRRRRSALRPLPARLRGADADGAAAPRDAPPAPDRDRGGDRAPGPRLRVVHARVAAHASRAGATSTSRSTSARTTRT